MELLYPVCRGTGEMGRMGRMGQGILRRVDEDEEQDKEQDKDEEGEVQKEHRGQRRS
jgi:hypothetical protein